jgi:hypothetical protein
LVFQTCVTLRLSMSFRLIFCLVILTQNIYTILKKVMAQVLKFFIFQCANVLEGGRPNNVTFM